MLESTACVCDLFELFGDSRYFKELAISGSMLNLIRGVGHLIQFTSSCER